jgi:ribosomal-protein-alanine N-acetyltransferase
MIEICRIHKETIEDVLNELCEIEKACFSQPWSRTAFEEWIKFDFAVLFVAFVEGKVAGYISADDTKEEIDIINVAVSPDYRRKGIGDALIERIKRQAKIGGAESLYLEVRCSNEPAINLYTKNGFEKVGERKNFYEKPQEDAIIYQYHFDK